ncbi:MAG: hypothetical protein AMJ91_04365 [candidate division Zixibacteria bacterium SM23_73_3]|nr:MAG: hypothetical protein AMJ91_04365 [candidate division Zixibacteria bacterium SM23_73_3]
MISKSCPSVEHKYGSGTFVFAVCKKQYSSSLWIGKNKEVCLYGVVQYWLSKTIGIKSGIFKTGKLCFVVTQFIAQITKSMKTRT